MLDITQSGPGVLTSPGFPSNYQDDTACTWTVVAAEGMRVALNFTHFHLEFHITCVFDVVEVLFLKNEVD